MKVIKSIFKMKQSEYLDAISRAKQRTSIKNSFYVLQLIDEIKKQKWEKNFWLEKYKNIKKESKNANSKVKKCQN